MATACLAFACGDDHRAGADTSLDGAVDSLTADDGTTADSASSDTGGDATLDVVVTPPRTDDTACNAAARVAACDESLLHDGAAPPTDAADLLYYLNRWYSIPADFPIPEASGFHPCASGAGETVDLSVDLVAPTAPGPAEGAWRLLEADAPFGDTLPVRIAVAEAQP